MALGPVAGGLIYDAFTSYVGLFVGAFALGLGPSLAAVVFARLPKGRVVAGEGTEAAGACAPVARADVTALLSPLRQGGSVA